MAKVFHAVNPTFGFGETPQWPEGYRQVAETETDELGKVFELTNTIDSDWWLNEGVKSLVGPCRSSSVGDVVVTSDGKTWRCEMVGWEEL